MLLVDTNVLIDVLQDDPAWADWSIAQLRAQAQVHALAINPVIYAELSLAFDSHDALDAVVAGMDLTVAEIPEYRLPCSSTRTSYLPGSLTKTAWQSYAPSLSGANEDCVEYHQ